MADHRLAPSLGAVLVALAVAACSEASAPSTSSPPAQGVAVAIAPDAATLARAGRQAFAVTVTGTIDQSVIWSVAEGPSGGAVTSGGAYTAPATAGSYHVVATSQADPTKTATATVTVTAAPPVVVMVSPATATVAAGASKAFTCSVSGAADTACTWSVQEGASGGGITAAGVYTAPSAAGGYHVVATSHADPTKSATAAVTVTAPPPVVTVSIVPATASVDACKTFTFGASVTGTSNTSVTWSVTEGSAGGTVSTAGVYTAPSSAGTYHVVATSQADATKSQAATVTVAERILSVAVSPNQISLPTSGTTQFTATVTTTCGAFTQTQTILANGTVTSP